MFGIRKSEVETVIGRESHIVATHYAAYAGNFVAAYVAVAIRRRIGEESRRCVVVVERHSHPIACGVGPRSAETQLWGEIIVQHYVDFMSVVEFCRELLPFVEFCKFSLIPHQSITYASAQSPYGFAQTEVDAISPTFARCEFLVPRQSWV